MTTNVRRRNWSSGLYYFLAGSVASTGINIVTSLATSDDRSADSLLLLVSSVAFLAFGYVLSLVGAITADFEERKVTNRLHELSDEEQAEIIEELDAQRRTQLARPRLFMIISAIVALAPIVAREAEWHIESLQESTTKLPQEATGRHQPCMTR